MDSGQKTAIKYDKKAFSDFFGNDANVVFAVIFGSAKNGTIRPGSDLDLAAYFHKPPQGTEELAYYSRLCEVDSRVERIDFVNLNRANEILAFEAINGNFICKNDIEKTAGFFSLVSREYEDVMCNIDHQYSLQGNPHQKNTGAMNHAI